MTLRERERQRAKLPLKREKFRIKTCVREKEK